MVQLMLQFWFSYSSVLIISHQDIHEYLSLLLLLFIITVSSISKKMTPKLQYFLHAADKDRLFKPGAQQACAAIHLWEKGLRMLHQNYTSGTLSKLWKDYAEFD